MGAPMPSGPRRLGGDSDFMNTLSPAQAAAMATEMRLRDDLWCAAPVTAGNDGPDKAPGREASPGSKHKDGTNSNESATKENWGVRENSQGSSLAVTGSGRISGGGVSSSTRTADGSSSGGVVLEDQSKNGGTGLKDLDGEGSQSSPIHISDDQRKSSQQDDLSWECQACTLQNKILSVTCVVCATPKIQEGYKVIDLQILHFEKC